ncbi:MAG: hypothetical protein HYR91_08125 [Flavobacteriia bacterium]|nr:hypothetical protein [Flavobacteriia bacterium]
MKLALFFSIFLITISNAQVGTGEWRLHIPNRNCIDVVALNGIVYAAFEDGILEYDIALNEKSMWDVVNSLSDIKITCLSVCSSNNSIFIGYENGNIDHLKDNKVTNIPAIKLAQILGSKKINRISESNGYMYVATDFAIVVINPIKNEVLDTYYPSNTNENILDVSFLNDTIYALTPHRVLKASVNNTALADFNQWNIDTRIEVLTNHKYNDIEVVNNQLYYSFMHDDYGKDSVFRVKNNVKELVSNINFSLELKSLNNLNNQIGINIEGGFLIFNDQNNLELSGNQYTFATPSHVNHSFYYDNTYWIAENLYGLVKFSDNWHNEKISFAGPPKDKFYAMDCQKGKLVIAGGGLNDISMQYNNAGVYTFETETWECKDKSTMEMWQQKYIWDFLDVAINPLNKEEFAVASYSFIPLSILTNGQVTDTFNYHNSIIQQTSLGNNMSLISDLAYDSKGNLWMLNGYSTQPLKVYTKDKEWKSFAISSLIINKFTNKLFIDKNDIIWFSVGGVGLIAFNANGTIMDPSDDKIKIINDGENSGALPSISVSAFTTDLNENLWIGTDNGFAILYNTSNIFEATAGNYNSQRIKLEYEGNIEYMLGSTSISDIVIDGGNRKWLGTSNTGIFLLSADGLEILAQYTTDNSPLISNTILDLQFDYLTGELYIITDKGLISYRTNSSSGMDDYSNVIVFPNPVKPDFGGVITMQGIKADSDIKITDIAGNLVYKTTSLGGTATWNGKTVTGEKVEAGVYLIWSTINEGKGRKVGKIVVIN